MNKKIVLFPDKLREESTTEEIFCGYIEGGLFLKDGNVRLSRTHRQPNRIYSANGIHPTISSSETQCRYFIAENEQPTGHRPNSQFSILNSQFPKMLNVITLFSGYDSQCLALNRLGIPYDLVAWAEIDKHACTAHDALFPQYKGRNVGDVSRVDWAEWHSRHPQPIDLLTYSSPCQDFSSAGLQRGGEEGSGTRSGLLWETERAVRELRPRHLVFENVGGLVSDKFIDLFNRWQARLNGYGYTNFQQLMNAKDYGVPQNRLRIFMVSILDCPRAYYFPKPFRLERRLKDVLEQNVEERYYLKEEQVQKLMKGMDDIKEYDSFYYHQSADFFRQPLHNVSRALAATQLPAVAEPQINILGQLSSSQNSRIIGTEGISPAVINGEKDGMPKIMEPTIASMKSRDKDNPTGVRTANNGNFAQRLEPSADQSTSNTITSVAKDNLLIEPTVLGWTRNEKGEITDRHPVSVANCVTAGKRDNTQNYVMEPNIRIRRLTERELYRLMDVSEPDIDTLLAAPIPRTQHAKLAGNSIVVACLYHIFRNLFVTTDPEAGTQTTIF